MRTVLLPLLCFCLISSPAEAARKPQKFRKKQSPTTSACPRTKKEWQAVGPRWLVEKALRQHAPIEIPDFSAKLAQKKGGASGSAAPIRRLKGQTALVEAMDKESSLYLSGMLRCDPAQATPVLLSLVYVKGKQSGLIPVTDP